MKYKIILSIMLMALFFPHSVKAVNRETPVTATDWIKYWADKNQVSSSDMIAVAICESQLYSKAVNRTDGNGGSFGLFQYQKATWNAFSQELGEDLDIWSIYDQSKLTAWAFSKGRQGNWSCARIVGVV